MPDEIITPSESTPSVTPRESKPIPWVTLLASAASTAIFFALAVQVRKDPPSWELLEQFGQYPPDAIWNGAYWGMITGVLVHLDWWHLALNLFWFWVFGSRLERAIGSLWYLAFILVAAFVSSALQLGVSGETGMGLSGVCYAQFGFLWVARKRSPQFAAVLAKGTVPLFVFWLLGCIMITLIGIFNFGNTAHVAGLLFGAIVSAGWFVNYKPRLMLAAAITLIGLSIVPLFWAPWSLPWLRHQAYAALVGEQYDEAITLCTRIIELDPRDPWAYWNRGGAYEVVGDLKKSEADLKHASDLEKPKKKAL